jgi:aryl-alcohol dehydrogenase-like predicted oxidoreductase
MKYRELGRTRLQVSEIGFGTWGMGKTDWTDGDDEMSSRALKAALDCGINFFDTALSYGNGHSERLLARAFGSSAEVMIASKVPPKNMVWPARAGTPLQKVFPKEHVLTCLNKTLKNLTREVVDVFQFHVWSDQWAYDSEWHETVQELKRSGKARFIGISVNEHQPTNVIKALDTGLVDTVQVIYNLFDQSAEHILFPYCQKHDIGVTARVPFDEGGLTGRVGPSVTFAAGDFRNWYFRGNRKHQVYSRAQSLATEADIPLDQLPDLALRFCLTNPTVSTVIPGMHSPDHVYSNASASEHSAIPDQLLAQLRQHRWKRNFYSASPFERLERFYFAPFSEKVEMIRKRL